MYAVVETGGKQIKVVEGESIFVELLDVEAGSEYTFDKVVLASGESVKIGTPYVDGARVVAEVEKHGKHKKIHIYKYRAKDGSSHKRQGHRQPYTKLVIKKIEA